MKIKERSIIEGLSYALDVAEKSYVSHSKHVAYICAMLAKELGMKKEEQTDLYFAGLLHDIGVGNSYTMQDHCVLGRELVLQLPVNNKIADYVYYHHELYNGTGPFGIAGEDIPLEAQIICFANSFDIMFSNIHKLSADDFLDIKRWLEETRELFNPKLTEAFSELIKKEYILLDYFNNEFNTILKIRIDVNGSVLEYDDVKNYANIFSKIIDNRSPFTYRHSVGIANLAYKITSELGFDDEIQNKMYISALLHDIGKLAVSNDIIDKPGKLDDKERFEINKHTYYTRWILSQIEGFEDITEFASNHHEKLNGKGYPLQLKENEIAELCRIMAICDIYQALTEDRPYRENMPIEKVWSIIDSMVEKCELDPVLVDKVKVILKDYQGC